MCSDESHIPVDPSGDIVLRITSGGEQKTVRVSSKVMSLASPVWKTMLDPRGPFQEADPDNGDIPFLDDDAEALLILLLAAHLRYQEIPEELSYGLLLQLCIVCDKYDCIEIVRPWLPKWMTSLAPLTKTDGHEEFLFIAWVVGDQALFERVCRKLVFESSTNPERVFDCFRKGPWRQSAVERCRLVMHILLIEGRTSITDKNVNA